MTQLKSTKDNDLFPNFVTDFFNSERFFGPGRWFENELETFVPAVNITESDKNYLIDLVAPGFEKSDFKIHVNGDLLSISAEKNISSQEQKERYTRKEFAYNSFSRSFSLPENSNADQIDATYEKGILGIKISKKVERVEAPKKEIKIT